MYRLLTIALGAIGAMSLLAVVLGVGASSEDTGPGGPAASAKTSARSESAQAMVLKRDGSGQFNLIASANGSEVAFLVDTGADMVALTEAEAENLGLMLDESDFEPMAVSGTPRSEAALRWSPARMPRPPEYCGSVSEMPNSGEKYATRPNGESRRPWNQRGASTASRNRSDAALVADTMSGLPASAAHLAALMAASSRSGSRPVDFHRPGSRDSNSCCVSRSQVQCRLNANSESGANAAGTAGTTLNSRTARIR